MKKILTTVLAQLATVQAFAQNEPATDHPSIAFPMGPEESISQMLLPILFMLSLVFMLVMLIRYFLEFRLKSKLIERGMAEQLSAYLFNKNDQEKQHEVIKLAILFCGVGAGLTLTYLTAPIDIHSLAIMAFSLGLSYLAYFFYLRR
jgi:Na+/H+ antiporter NhaD/arsenite permease-like protein